ncbi:Low affinity vacuolar monovalent cation/H(+) antiporter [Yarrowia sp. B02]|nr:Low affinity vacuolar monovalent cation/H(+) antiporter [Yarrowia sp. B02]
MGDKTKPGNESRDPHQRQQSRDSLHAPTPDIYSSSVDTVRPGEFRSVSPTNPGPGNPNPGNPGPGNPGPGNPNPGNPGPGNPGPGNPNPNPGTPSIANLHSPSISKSLTLPQPRSSLTRGASTSHERRYQYSVDDDEYEFEADLEREFLEGYAKAIKDQERKRRKKKQSISQQGGSRDASRLSHGGSLSHVKSRDSVSASPSPLIKPDFNPAYSDHDADQCDLDGDHDLHPQISHRSGVSQRSREEAARDESAHDESANADDNDDSAENDDSADDSASLHSNESYTLKERQAAINTTHPFGIRIWKPAIYKKNRSVQAAAEGDIHMTPGKTVGWRIFLGNCLWTLSFGLLLYLVCGLGYVLCSLFFWSESARQYGRVLHKTGFYLLYPFGQFVQLAADENYLHEDEGEGRTLGEYERWQAGDLEHGRLFFGPDQRNPSPRNPDPSNPSPGNPSPNSPNPGSNPNHVRTPLLGHSRSSVSSASENSDSADSDVILRKRRFFGRGEWNLGRIVFYTWFYVIITPVIYTVSLICWFLVFLIPMGKVTNVLCYHLRRHPLALKFKSDSKYYEINGSGGSGAILLCTYRAFGWKYYKYTIDGTNIFFINLIGVVFFGIFSNYFLRLHLGLSLLITSPLFIFVISLVSVIPLAYFIGQAVASISAQTSMGMGAAINAFFSTIVEVFLYCVALSQGKSALVEGSIIGSILAGVLLLPGLSMCTGAIKRKTQRYNPKSAGVSSTMLLFAILGTFAPTFFYQIHGKYEIRCDGECDAITNLISHADSAMTKLGQMSTQVAESAVSQLGHVADSAQKVLTNPDLLSNAPALCRKCQFFQVPLVYDDLYQKALKPLSGICAILLFVSYIIGLWFTLRTHAAMIWQTPIHEKKEVVIPNPGRSSSVATPVHRATPATILDDPAGLRKRAVESPNLGPNSATNPNPGNHNPGNAGPGHNPNPGNNPNPGVTLATPLVVTTAAPEDAPEGHEPDANWSRSKSTFILLSATLLYAVVAEMLVDTVDVVLENAAIGEKLLGITIFALVPNTTEFLNAISFAMGGNIALSMEIGSAYALQVCLLQIPALVLYSMWNNDVDNGHMFTLIFPRWDLFVVMICVFLFSYIYAEGKSNYFKGSILVLAYCVVMVGFYFDGMVSEDGFGELAVLFGGRY